MREFLRIERGQARQQGIREMRRDFVGMRFEGRNHLTQIGLIDRPLEPLRGVTQDRRERLTRRAGMPAVGFVECAVERLAVRGGRPSCRSIHQPASVGAPRYPIDTLLQAASTKPASSNASQPQALRQLAPAGCAPRPSSVTRRVCADGPLPAPYSTSS